MLRTRLIFLLSSSLALATMSAHSQPGSPASDSPAFDAASIKPPAPGEDRKIGFYGEPGGRVFFGGSVRLLVEYAFDLQDYQLPRETGWTSSQWFDINAVPPDSSASRGIGVANAEPTSEQRLMLQNLLRDRFGFQSHFESKEGDVYILSRGSKSLDQLKPPKDAAADPRVIVVSQGSGIIDGEAQGINATADYLALRLARYLRAPVSNETALTGSFDFNLPADSPDNNDIVSAVHSVVDRLGLKLKRGRGPIQTLVIDHVMMWRNFSTISLRCSMCSLRVSSSSACSLNA